MQLQRTNELPPTSVSTADYDARPRTVPFEGTDADAARQKVEAAIRWGITEAPIAAYTPMEPTTEITGTNQYGDEKPSPFPTEGVRFGTEPFDSLLNVAGAAIKNT